MDFDGDAGWGWVEMDRVSYVNSGLQKMRHCEESGLVLRVGMTKQSLTESRHKPGISLFLGVSGLRT